MIEKPPINPAYISREAAVQHNYEIHMKSRLACEQRFGAKICDLCVKFKSSTGRLYGDEIEEDRPELNQLLSGRIGMFENDFPYHYVAGAKVKSHHILIPMHHLTLARDLDKKTRENWHNALDELEASKRYSYSFTQFPSDSRSSIPDHLHKHYIEFDNSVILDSIDYKSGEKAEVNFRQKRT